METPTLPPAELVIWQIGTPPVGEGECRRYWCAVRGVNGKIYHRLLAYLNRHRMPVGDGLEPCRDAEPVPDSEDEYFWTGWYESSCDQCETQWRYTGEVIAWMALPKLTA